DEAHHASARTWRKVLEKFPVARVLGLSATPITLSGEPLDDLFDVLVCGPSVRELEHAGFLVRMTIFAPPFTEDLSGVREVGGDFDRHDLAAAMMAERLLGDPIDHWERHVVANRGPAPTILFAVNVAHSKAMAARARARGFRAMHIDAATPDN